MRKMTEENLKNAFAGDSQAHMRYLIFAEKAEEEGLPNVARLFSAIAYAEQVHAANHFNVLGMVRNSAENHEINEMYPAYSAVVKFQEERGAQRTTEKIHAGMYQKAKQAVESGKDMRLGDIYICEVCGYTTEGEAPDRCPVCGASKERFPKILKV